MDLIEHDTSVVTECKISPILVLNVSPLYSSARKVLLEFIDNSIDSGEIMGNLTGDSEYEFKKKVEIKVEIIGKYYRSGKIRISDNCSGIKELKDIVQRIGNSKKKAQTWTNGQFGYGIYSFMAACEEMEIETKHSDNTYSEYIKIKKDDFRIDDINKLKFNIIRKSSTDEPFTTVKLSGFNIDSWSEIDYNSIKSEIENHFEHVLRRPGIKVIIKDNDGKKYECEPYNYNRYEGEKFEKEVEITKYDSGSRKSTSIGNIKIFLKINPKVAVDRPPILISKMRRVIELWRVQSFRSNNRREIWNNPSIEGYIDTKGLLEPTIARTDFLDSEYFKAVKKAILSQEDEILEVIRKTMASAVTNDFSEIESSFNSELFKIEDSVFSGEKGTKPGIKVKISNSGNEIIDVLIPDPLGTIYLPFSDGKRGKHLNFETTSEPPRLTPMLKSREFVKTPEKNKINLKIKIDDESEPLIDTTGKQKRSELLGNEVVIYKKHPDFIDRIKNDGTGKEYITSELINYISSEVLLHYTSTKFHMKPEEGLNSKPLLLFFTDKLYALHKNLKGQINKPLSK